MLILFFSNFDITLLINPSISTYISLFSGNILELSPLIKSLGTPIVIASLVFKLILLLEIILLIIIVSFTVLARIPTVSLSGSYGSTQLLLINFVVGRYPIILAADAGILIEEFVSVPSAAGANDNATLTALPPDDPYEEYSLL